MGSRYQLGEMLDTCRDIDEVCPYLEMNETVIVPDQVVNEVTLLKVLILIGCDTNRLLKRLVDRTDGGGGTLKKKKNKRSQKRR